MRGWRVASVPWFQWQALSDARDVGAADGGAGVGLQERRQRYLEDLMDGVLWRTHQTMAGTGMGGEDDVLGGRLNMEDPR